jgi:oxygen-independent coproporphyrinogen-3 oxidase
MKDRVPLPLFTDRHPAPDDPDPKNPTPPQPHPPGLVPGDIGAIQALYFHIPFCFHKCHYCDFYSIVDEIAAAPKHNHSPTHNHRFVPDPNAPPPPKQSRLVDRLIEELHLRCGQFSLQPTTIFFGGGTPTLLHPALWRRLLNALRETGVLHQVQEFTVEANPETVTPELMDTLTAGGVNRVSVGAQSFNPASLKTLERWHDPAHVARAVEIIRNAGIENFNLDLIFAIPGQTLPMVEADVEAALALNPQHVSCYGLTYEPQTPMAHRLGTGQIRRVDEELERAMYERVMIKLERAGFEHYEVSNWARPGRRCRHNVGYWVNTSWLGIGPAAASHVGGCRWKNLPHLGRYLDESPEPLTTDHEHLPADQSIGEQLMLRLRMLEGVPIRWLDNHLQPDDPRRQTIREMTRLGMLEITPERLRLSRNGLFVADTVIGKLL